MRWVVTHLAPVRLVVPPAVVWGLAAAGLVFATAVSALAWQADPVAWWAWTPMRLVAAGLIVVGARRWGLLFAFGVSFFVRDLRVCPDQTVYAVGFCLAYLYTAFAAHVALALPAKRLPDRLSRGLAVAAYAGAVGTQLVRYVVDHPQPPPNHPAAVDHSPAANVGSVIAVVIGCVIVAVLVHHWRTASSFAAPWIAAIGGALLSVGVAVAAVLRAPGPVKLGVMVGLFALAAVASAAAYWWHAVHVRLTRWRLATIAEERRRIQRDVHDGAQQRLFAASILMDVAKQHLSDGTAAAAVTRAQSQLADAISALRELTTGIYPRTLIEDGVAAALEELCDRSPVPVVLDVEPVRRPRAVEEAAYFLVAEALTNVYRHAQASKAHVTVRESGGWLFVTVADDGIGGVRGPLRSVQDRVTAADGQLLVDSPPGIGTTVRAGLPLPSSVSR